MITIDGYEWNVPCNLERVAEITPSEISGMLLDKSYFNDVLGTFLRYEVTLAVPPSMESDYATLYESLTDPVDAHTFVMPYNQNTVTLTARVENVTDVLVYTASKRQYWKGVKFSVIANHPTKSDELGDAIERGLSPMPEVYGAAIGSVYELTENGWIVYTDYEDIDEVYF